LESLSLCLFLIGLAGLAGTSFDDKRGKLQGFKAIGFAAVRLGIVPCDVIVNTFYAINPNHNSIII